MKKLAAIPAVALAVVVAVAITAGCGSTCVNRTAQMLDGPPVSICATDNQSASRAVREIKNLPDGAAFPHGADDHHWTQRVYQVKGDNVVVQVRLVPGFEHPGAKLKGHGRGFTFKSGPYA